jgi:TPR repeat protein
MRSGGSLKRTFDVRCYFNSFRPAKFFAIVVLFFLACLPAEAAGKRVALVVGNGAYQSVAQLPNPRKDAEAVSTALRKQGFEVVTAIDLTRIELEQAVERYVRALNGSDISLFYYSGHGIEVGGENRIIPVDATLAAPEDLETQTYSLQTILLYMQSKSKAQLIYLDACRDNPFNDRAFLLGVDDTEKPAGKGLAEQKGSIGSLIAYATEPGKVALDGAGENSPFTSAVIKHSFSQNVDVQSALMQVTADVWEATQQSQRPWINSTLVKPVFLNSLAEKPLATNPPATTKSLAEIQITETTRHVEAGPVTIGAGAQRVFDEVSVQSLPPAKFYKLMQMPLTGTLYVEDQVVPEGAVIDFDKFKVFSFEPSTDVQVYKDANTSALLVPAITLETAAIAADGSALPVQIKIQQRMHECDLLAAEPLDLQGLGQGVTLDKIDVTQSLAACQKAVDEQPGNTRYIYLLGRAQLASGNTKAALLLFQQAAEKGYIRATFQLGDMALNGLGMAKDLVQANAWFKQAADQGDPMALLAYGRNLVKGIGLKADPKQGIAILKRASELGNSEALDELGSLYLYGGAIKASPKRAVGFFDASVTRSVKTRVRQKTVYIKAATDIGALYFKGDGVQKDLRQAIKWYELGAERGNQDGSADLSWIYAHGPGDLRNPVKAVWYTSLALATDKFGGDGDLLRRLALLPDDAKRSAMRDFVDLVGPCATRTTDGIDDTLLLLSRKAWAQRQSDAGTVDLPTDDGSFEKPSGREMEDELRYWNLVNGTGSDAAYLAYLRAFPDGVFAGIARGHLGGLLERVKQEPKLAACETPKLAKPPTRKADPVKPKQPLPLVQPIKVRPKPKPIVEKPKKRPPVVKRPRPPRVIIEEDPPIIDEEPPVFEQDDPVIDQPPKRRRLRLPRFPRRPQNEDPCTLGDC